MLLFCFNLLQPTCNLLATYVIDKAKAACDTSKIKVSDHFADVRKIVKATFAVKLLSYGIDPVDGFTVRETAAVYGIPREYADMLQKCLFA